MYKQKRLVSAFDRHMHECGRAYLDAWLKTHRGNVNRVAKSTGKCRTKIYDLFKRYGIDDLGRYRIPVEGET